jgi:uncharacterized phiE125 gp8 family phage protein
VSRTAWTRTVEPTQEPVTLADCKAHARGLMDLPDEDGLFALYIKAARVACEEYLERAVFTQTWKLVRDGFCAEMELPRAAPLQTVTSVKYYDTTGTQQTLATTVYRVDTDSTPGRVVLKPDQSWPDVQTTRGQAVEIIYVCGWSSVATIPASLKVAMASLAAHLYLNREGVQVGVGIGAVEVPLGPKWFMDPYKLWAA